MKLAELVICHLDFFFMFLCSVFHFSNSLDSLLILACSHRSFICVCMHIGVNHFLLCRCVDNFFKEELISCVHDTEIPFIS